MTYCIRTFLFFFFYQNLKGMEAEAEEGFVVGLELGKAVIDIVDFWSRDGYGES